MKLFAIADLHLSGNPPTKPMHIFGENWRGHWENVKADWQNKVKPEDVVLLAGDTSWGMRWGEAAPDLEEIIALPGKKILIRGNHDYWWQTIAKMSTAVDGKLTFLQNNFVAANDWAICGSRGWIFPGTSGFSPDDQAIYARELGRLRLSLAAARQAGFQQLIVMLHYPPTDAGFRSTGFTELLAEYKVALCLYGHLHGEAATSGPIGAYSDTEFLLVACDATNFSLRQILNENGRICSLDGE